MPQQPIANVKALSVLHFSLFIGQVMFAFMAGYLIYSTSFEPVITNDEQVLVLGAGVIGLSLTLVIAAFVLFKKKVEKISLNPAVVTEKLTAYRASSIIRWAMLEVPTILTIVVYLLTGNEVLLIVVGVLMLVFYYAKPRISKTAQDLGLTEEEIN